MSRLQNIFAEQTGSLESSVMEFISSTRKFDNEITALQDLLVNPNFERALALFSIEVLSRAIKTKKDFSNFIHVLLAHIERSLTYKNSIFILRIIHNISDSPFYIPLSYYLTKLAELSILQKQLKRTGKSYTFDNVRLSSDDLKSEELQIFVFGESLKMIRKQCLKFGSNIGFPELAFSITSELRRSCKVGLFKESVSDLIKWIIDRKEYIESKRKELKIKHEPIKSVADFERTLEPWEVSYD